MKNIDPSKLKMVVFEIAKGEFKPFTSSLAEDVTSMAQYKDCLPRPIDPFILAKMADVDPTHRTCIDKKTSLTAGLGYKFLEKGNKRKMKKFMDFAKNPNNNPFETLTDISKKLQEDFETYDDGFVEFIKVGSSFSIYHISSKDIFIEPNKRGKKIRAGDVKKFWQIHKINGVQSFEPYKGGKIVDGIHYMAQLRGYSSSSSFYGVPRYISSYPAMLENLLIRKYGMNFFENDARPSIAILISGGSLNAQTEKNIQEMLQTKYKGVENSHKVLVISVDDREAKVDIKEISKSIDGNFLKEYEKNRDEIARTHQTPPKILGISAAGSLGSGSETIGSLKQFVEETIKPKQTKLENFFNSIFEAAFDVNPLMKFNTIDLINEKDDAVVVSLLSKIKNKKGKTVFTIEEIREKFNMPKELDGEPLDIEGSKPASNTSGDATVPGNTGAEPDAIETIDEKDEK